jgi:hypothetical protein
MQAVEQSAGSHKISRHFRIPPEGRMREMVERLKGKKKPNLYEEAESFLRAFRPDRTPKRPSAIKGK